MFKRIGFHAKRFARPVAATLLALFATLPSSATAVRALEIGMPVSSDQAQVALAVLNRAYADAGLELRPLPLPLRRSLQEAAAGTIDGELMRIASVLDETETLVRVNVPIVQTRYTAYMKAERCPRQISVDELAQRRVSYPRGIRAIELMLPAERLIGVTRYADSIRQLELGIADAMLGVELEVDLTLTRQGARGICKIAEPLVRLELYHGLHRRHAAIVPRLEQALGALQRSGEMARIWAAEEKKLRDAAPPVP